MFKKMKKIPRWGKITLSTFLVVILLIAAFFGRTLHGLRLLEPIPTRAITDDVYAVLTGPANFFLIRGDSGYIAIDAGANKEEATEGLSRLGIDPSRIVAIFLTHSDSDHTAAISLFPNARLYLSEQEVQMIDGTTDRTNALFRVLSRVAGLHLPDPGFPYEYQTLVHNDKKEIDGVFVQSILTPGHTPGSMSFLVNERYLFTGDAMSLRDGRAGRMPHLLDMNNQQAIESISKIATISAQYIFTSHHGYSGNLDFVFENWD